MFKKDWLMPGAVVPVDMETTAALTGEIKRLMHIVRGMALNQRYPWVGLTDEDLIECERLADIRHRKHMGSIRGQQLSPADQFLWHYARAVEAMLKEKNS